MLLILDGIAVYFVAAQFKAANQSQKIIQQLVAEIKANQDASDKKILDHIDCIGLFLAQPNRAEVRLEDLQNCKISSTGVSVTPSVIVPVSSPIATTQTPNPNPSPTPTPSPTPPQSVSMKVANEIKKILRKVGL